MKDMNCLTDLISRAVVLEKPFSREPCPVGTCSLQSDLWLPEAHTLFGFKQCWGLSSAVETGVGNN